MALNAFDDDEKATIARVFFALQDFVRDELAGDPTLIHAALMRVPTHVRVISSERQRNIADAMAIVSGRPTGAQRALQARLERELG